MRQRPERPAEFLAQHVGPPRLVVDVADQRVLDGNPPTGQLCVVVGRVEDLADLVDAAGIETLASFIGRQRVDVPARLA